MFHRIQQYPHVTKTSRNYLVISIIAAFFITNCDKEVTVSEPVIPEKGSITIKSDPTNAKVYWEGYYTGYKTPYTLVYLDYKAHEFILKLNYYRDTVFSLEAVENEPKEIFIDYFKNPLMYGSLNCVSEPSNANIFINDSSTGKTTPYVFDHLVPGLYKVKYSYPEHREDSLIVTVRSSTIPKANLTLQDTSIWVDYQRSNSGITEQYLTCIAVDQDDVKWMGTSSYGVLTFNGKNWNSYNTSNSPIPSNSIQEIGIDPETGKKWICTAAGVGIYDGATWEVYTPFNSILRDANFTAVEFFGGGKTWLGTSGEGLAIFDGTKWELFVGAPKNKYLPSPNISDLFVDNEGILWVGNLYRGLNQFNGTRWRRYFWHGFPPSFMAYNYSGYLNSNRVKSISRDAAGRVWIGYWGGNNFVDISMFDEYGFHDFGKIIEGAGINSIFVDDHDNKWVGTESSLTRFKEVSSRVVYIEANSGLSSNYVTQITQDSKGVIWISTYGGGLVKFKGEL